MFLNHELLEPTIYLDPESGEVSNGENVTISCKGDIRSRGGTFHLYKDRKGNSVQTRNVTGDERIVTFNINTRSKRFMGNYSCRYQTEVAGHLKQSRFSKGVVITEKVQYLTVALVRLCISALVVIVMVIFIVEHLVSAMSPEGKETLDKTCSPGRHNRQNMVDESVD